MNAYMLRLPMNKRSICFVYNTSQYLYKFRLELMESLLKEGYSVYAIAPVDRYSTKFQMHNIKFISIVVDRRGYNIFKDIKLVWSLTHIYRKISPLIVHHFTIKPVLYGSLVGRLAKIPKIINSITGLGYTFINSSWSKWLICKLYYISQKSDKIQLIFQNPDDRDFFLDKNLIRNNQSNLILSSGVNLEIFKCSDSQRGRDTHQCTFLFLSRILYDKGIVELVEAMEMLFHENKQVKLIIAGEVDSGNPGPVSKDWMDKKSNLSFIDWLGYLDDVTKLFSKVDVAVLPSYREGVPHSLIEALAMGLPVITTDTPGCRVVVDHGLNGFMVPPRDSNTLFKAMLKLANDYELRKKFGKYSFEKSKEFDVKKINKETTELYK